jgi:hypothetical protein
VGPPVVVITFFPRHAIEASTAVCLSWDTVMHGRIMLRSTTPTSNQNIRSAGIKLIITSPEIVRAVYVTMVSAATSICLDLPREAVRVCCVVSTKIVSREFQDVR